MALAGRSLVSRGLNRPHRLNAVSLSLYERLVAELEAAEADRDIRCVILTGSGRAFCAGADLKAHRDRPQCPPRSGGATPTWASAPITSSSQSGHLSWRR